MDILMSETRWAHNKWNKIASDIKLVFHSSTIAMMHGPINIRSYNIFYWLEWRRVLNFPLLPKAEGFLNLSGGHPEIFTGAGVGGGGLTVTLYRIMFDFKDYVIIIIS